MRYGCKGYCYTLALSISIFIISACPSTWFFGIFSDLIASDFLHSKISTNCISAYYMKYDVCFLDFLQFLGHTTKLESLLNGLRKSPKALMQLECSFGCWVVKSLSNYNSAESKYTFSIFENIEAFKISKCFCPNADWVTIYLESLFNN